MLSMVVYMGVVLYAPCLALKTITGFKVTYIILVGGFVGTLYTVMVSATKNIFFSSGSKNCWVVMTDIVGFHWSRRKINPLRTETEKHMQTILFFLNGGLFE